MWWENDDFVILLFLKVQPPVQLLNFLANLKKYAKKTCAIYHSLFKSTGSTEVGIYKRKQENTLTTKKASKKKRKKTRSRPRKCSRKKEKNLRSRKKKRNPFFFSWLFSLSRAYFLSFSLSYFLVFFYKFCIGLP